MELEQLMLQIRDGASNLTTENVSMKRLFLVIKIWLVMSLEKGAVMLVPQIINNRSDVSSPTFQFFS